LGSGMRPGANDPHGVTACPHTRAVRGPDIHRVADNSENLGSTGVL